jgi:predicted nicotinamide N-methyase
MTTALDPDTAVTPVDVLSRVVLSQWWLPALAVAHRLRMPAVLSDGAKSPGQVAADVGADQQATGVLLGMLAALGVCARVGEQYRLADGFRECLAGEGEADWGPMLRLAWDERCTRLLESVVSGSPRAFGRRGLWASVREADWLRSTFVAAMHARSVPLARRLALRIPETFSGHLLDVGTGSGVYAREILKARPGCRVTLLDVPEVVRGTRIELDKDGFDGRVEWLPGDMFAAEWPQADIVLLSDVLHDWPDDACARLIARAAGSLAVGGLVMVHDMELTEPPDDETASANSVSMVATTGGRQRRPEEIAALAESAGLEVTDRFHTSHYYTVTTARKGGRINHE